MRKSLPSAPIDAAQLKKLAKNSKVSELAAAIRVVNLAGEIGLDNAAIVFFKEDIFQWLFSTTLKMTSKEASVILKAAKKSRPDPARIPNEGTRNHIVVASIIENPYTSSTALFIQLLPDGSGRKITVAEERRRFEDYLFADDAQFRNQMQGVLSGFRGRSATMSLDEAVAEFFETKAPRWKETHLSRLLSSKGRAYIRLRLSEWFEK